jgi:hypothetical protein
MLFIFVTEKQLQLLKLTPKRLVLSEKIKSILAIINLKLGIDSLKIH